VAVRERTLAMSPQGPKKTTNKTPERVFDATARLLKENGYASLRVRDVGRLAGLQAGSLYYYVESKEKLVEDVLLAGLERTHTYVQRRVESLPASYGALERLFVAIESHLNIALEISDYAAAYITVLPQVPDEVRKRVLAREHAFLEYWYSLLHNAQEAGRLRADLDLKVIRTLLVGALTAAAAASRIADAETWARNAVALVDGLVPR
jgi:AcrR family transcriptional regulator